MTITALPEILDLAAWDEFIGAQEHRHELVRGVPVMSPGEAPINTTATVTLCALLDRGFGRQWKAVPQLQVRIPSDRHAPTVRVPDIALMPGDADRYVNRREPSEIPLAVEFVSPSSVEIDWLVKRDEYAAAGIPNYLVLDLRTPGAPRMALFDTIVDGHYTDPQPDGTRCTVTIDGTSVDLHLDDILAW